MEKLSACAVRIPVSETSRVAEVRRLAVAMARDCGLTEERAAQAGLAATEAATNLVKHARGGEIHLRPLGEGPQAGIELISMDRGPGMADVEHCIRDGYSSAGTSGNGLGAMARLADEFDVWSAQPSGTVVVARLYAAGRTASRFETGEFAAPIAGETVCGDATAVVETGAEISVLAADGLGHGPDAATAADTAVRTFLQGPGLPPGEHVGRIHRALRPTRGAAVAVAAVRPGLRQVAFAGIGNISARIASPVGTRLLVSHNGTAGHHARHIQEFTYEWGAGDVLILHSDGLNTHWKLDRWPGIPRHHPAILAALLCRDESRGRDDMSAIVVREKHAA